MKAVCWNGVHDVRVEDVPEPVLINPHDAIVKVRATTISGSDLHLYNGYIPTMAKGDIIGHEFMGEVVELGTQVTQLKVGDRVVVPSVIGCGHCFYCQRNLWSLCDNSNPKPAAAERVWGGSPSGFFGYSHLMGGYAGSHAEYVRVPFADVGPRKIPDSISDERALFISDALPTGYMAADFCGIQQGDTIAVWGCGAVGQFAIRSAFLLGAERVIAIDRIPERLRLAAEKHGAEILNFQEVNIIDALKELTGGQGPDACIDAVGLEAHESPMEAAYDRIKQTVRMETDRPHVVREAIYACRKGGTVSVVGIYNGWVDKFPLGAAMNKGLTLRMGQMHAHRYMDRLIEHVSRGEIDPSLMVSHRMPLEQTPRAFEMFRRKEDQCLRVVLKA